MVFVSIEDFYEKAGRCAVLTPEEAMDCALRMKAGDETARERLIQSYTPMVARYVKRLRTPMQTLTAAMYCMHALERAVDSFDFTKGSETFPHYLSLYLKQAAVKYIAR